MADFLGLLPSLPEIRVVDVGAMSLGEGTDAYEALMRAGIARVLGFEPVAAECERLNAAADSRRRFLPHAIGDGSRRTLHICNFPMTSSLYPPDTELLDRFQNLENLTRVVARHEVETRRLDDLREVGEVDFLKVDVQGAERDVFAGATRTLRDVVAIHTEVQFVPLYRGAPTFSDVDIALRERGFLLHRFVGASGRCFKPLLLNGNVNAPGSQLLWADAVYLPHFMQLGRLSAEKLLKLAIILHAVYQSVDACAYVLREHQRRAGGRLADRYLAGVVQGGPQPPAGSA